MTDRQMDVCDCRVAFETEKWGCTLEKHGYGWLPKLSQVLLGNYRFQICMYEKIMIFITSIG